jgi:hypothetical protein
MASTVTTFAVFQTLLQRSVDLDPNLDSATKAAMKTRIQNLAREQEIVLGQPKASSTSGAVTENPTTQSIDVAIAALGTNRVEFDPIQFFVPVTVDGTKGVRGFMPGVAGTSVLPLVAQAGITLQYRLASGDPWSNFDRTTLLSEVTWIQFAANIADQVAASSLPDIHIHAEQV